MTSPSNSKVKRGRKAYGSGQQAERGRKAYSSGQQAERWAALWLRLKGYRVLARAWRVPQGEIDLIVKRGSLLAFVEVKSRRNDQGAAAIRPKQQKRIERAAEVFLQRNPQFQSCQLRLDAVVIGGGLFPQHLPGAWSSHR